MDDFEVIYKNNSRYYVKDKKEFPSVTSVLHVKSPFKSKPGNAAKLGTLIHYNILKMYSSEPLDIPCEILWKMEATEITDRIQAALIMWRDMNFQFKFRNIETVIFDNELGVAGRLDADGYDSDNMLSVLDIKTGLDYGTQYDMQLAVYAKAIGAERAYLAFLDTREDRNPSKTGKIRRLDKPDLDTAYDKFRDCLEEFKSKVI
jgi:hypothetical protein